MPDPAADPAPDARPDAKTTADLRQQVAETHAIAVRTQNQVANLAALLKEVVAQKLHGERRLNLNSFVAYVIFTLLLGGGFYLLFRSAERQLVRERDAATRRREEALDEVRRVRAELDAKKDAAARAADFYQLFRDGKKADAIARYPEIAQIPLTPVEDQVFRDGVAKARAEIIDAGYAQGIEAFQAQQWKRASTELKRSLTYEEEGPRAAQIRYYLGVSLSKLGDYQESARQLELAIAGGAERTVGPDARFFLAAAAEQLRQFERARTEYLKFADGHPGHPLSVTARRKAVEMQARTAKGP